VNVTVTQPDTVTVVATNGGAYSTTFTAQLNSNPSGGTGTYTYTWSGPMSFSSTAQNPSRPNASVGMSGLYKVTVTDANGCTASASTIMNVYDGYVWSGAVSSDWNDPANWLHQAVFTYPDQCSRNAFIQAPSGSVPNQPIVSSPETVGNVTMLNGSQLTLNADLTVCGNWTGSSTATTTTIVLGSGKVILTHTPFAAPFVNLQQQLSGKTRFNQLRLDNGAGALITNTGVVSIMDVFRVGKWNPKYRS
jgi:hypothetical protein